MRKIMACLDVGSDTVKLVVGEMVKKKLNILAVAESPSRGVKNGVVEDPSILLKSLEDVIQKGEEVIGLRIKQLILSISSKNASFTVVEGTVPIENEGNMIDGNDVIRVFQKAIKSKITENLEYVSMMPTSFSLDDNRVVNDPKGLTSKELTVRGVMVSTPKKNIYPILACLERLNVDVLDIALDVIGDYFEFKNKELDKKIGAVVNLGAETSAIAIFNKGVLTNVNVIDLGGKNIDNDISFIYKVPGSVSKKLKETFALAHSKMASSNDVVEVEDKSSYKVNINQSEISEVVMSRLDEILNLTKKEINHLTKKEISYIIFTGGLTESRDFKLILEEVYGRKAVVGTMMEVGARNNKYSSCIGIIKYYAYNSNLKNKDFSIFSIDEQQDLSGINSDEQDSTLGKLFGYLFNG